MGGDQSSDRALLSTTWYSVRHWVVHRKLSKMLQYRIPPKLIFDLPMISFQVVQSFRNFIYCRGVSLSCSVQSVKAFPDSKVHGAYMGPTQGRQDTSGPHVGSMIPAIWDWAAEIVVTGATVEVWEQRSNFIPHFTGHVITYSCWD